MMEEFDRDVSLCDKLLRVINLLVKGKVCTVKAGKMSRHS